MNSEDSLNGFQERPISEDAQKAMRRRVKARFALERRGRDLLLVYSPRNGVEFVDKLRL